MYPTLRYRTEVIRAEKVNNLVGVNQGPNNIAKLLSKVDSLNQFEGCFEKIVVRMLKGAKNHNFL